MYSPLRGVPYNLTQIKQNADFIHCDPGRPVDVCVAVPTDQYCLDANKGGLRSASPVTMHYSRGVE